MPVNQFWLIGIVEYIDANFFTGRHSQQRARGGAVVANRFNDSIWSEFS
jgi:hypothetical protein